MTNKKKRNTKYRARAKSARSKPRGRSLDYLLVSVAALVILFVASFAVKFSLGESAPVKQEQPVFLNVQVLNGCGVSGIAAKFSKVLTRLSTAGFIIDVIEEDNFSSFKEDYSFMLVRNVSVKDAETFADMIGMPRERIIYKELADNYLDINITVVVGGDYDNYLSRGREKN